MIKAEAPEIYPEFSLFMHLASMSKIRGAEIQLPHQHKIQMLRKSNKVVKHPAQEF